MFFLIGLCTNFNNKNEHTRKFCYTISIGMPASSQSEFQENENICNFRNKITSILKTSFLKEEVLRLLEEELKSPPFSKKMQEFVTESNSHIIFFQIFDACPVSNLYQIAIFSSIDQIQPNNILLCVFTKKNKTSNTLNDFYIHIFNGDLDDKFFEILNSTKPIIENFFLHFVKKQEVLTDIMRSYSDYELTLFQLQRSQNFESVRFEGHSEVIGFIRENKEWGSKISDFKKRIDENVIKEIYNGLLSWISEIQRVLMIEGDLFSAESCLVEISHWRSKDHCIKTVIETFKSSVILLSLKILEDTSYRTINEKLSSIIISDRFVSVNRVFTFLNTLKLGDLITAKNMDDLISITKSILYVIDQHNVNNYPTERIFGLSALIAKDLNKSILRLFPKLELLSFDDFSYQGVVFKVLSLHTDFLAFITSLKTANRRSASLLKDKISQYTQIYNETLNLTISRIKEIQNLFDSYQFCVEMFEILQRWISMNPYKEFSIKITEIIQQMPDLKSEWFSFLKSIDLLDFSKNGVYLWNERLNEYHNRLKSRDSSFVESLRILLNESHSDNEKIDLFIHFTVIFKKFPIIQSIHSVQISLIDKIYRYMMNEKDNILKSSDISSKKLRKLYSFGDCSIQLMNIKKLTEKYKQYLFYTYCILGPNYRVMDISRKIILESKDWSKKNLALNILNTLTERGQSIQKNRIFIFKICDELETKNIVAVNFQQDLLKLSLDEIYARSLGFSSTCFYWLEPNLDKNKCLKIIDESLCNLRIVKKELFSKEEFCLIALYIENCHIQILSGLSIHWDSVNLQRFTIEFNESVTILNEKADIVLGIRENLRTCIESLKNIDFKFENVKEKVSFIKNELSQIDNHQLYNIEYYFNTINQQVEDVLYSRLEISLNEFLEVLNVQSYDKENIEIEHLFPKSTLFKSGCLKPLNFDIKFLNEEICIAPNLLNLRGNLYSELNKIINVVISQNYLLSNALAFTETAISSNYKHLLKRISKNSIINQIYKGFEKLIFDINGFYKSWSCFKILWDSDFSTVTQNFKTIDQWLEFYNSLNSLKICKTNKNYRVFPFVIIRYKLIKTRLNAKYTEWVTKIFTSISELFNTQNDSICKQIQVEREKLRSIVLTENSSIEDIVKCIGDFESQKEKIQNFKILKETVSQVESILNKNNISYQPPTLNIFVEFEDLCLEYEKCKSYLDNSIEFTRIKVSGESKILLDDINKSLIEWETFKANFDNLDVKSALNQASNLNSILKEGLSCAKNISRAKLFLNIPENLDESYNLPYRLESAIDELSDIKKAWEFVGDLDSKIQNIGEKQFHSISSVILSKFIEDLILKVKEATSIQGFKCVIDFNNKLYSYSKMNEMINSLRSDFFKDRHWRLLFSKFNTNFHPSNLTISQIWSLNLDQNSMVFNEVFNTAQGEFGLENYLKSIDDYWSCCQFFFIPFKTKFEIVNNWVDIVSKLGDHINGIESMKSSPYYKEFAIIVEQWLEKLTFLLNLSEIWIEVQRKWIYLTGIFLESSDIAKLLSSESSKFNACTNEFIGLIHKISKDPSILSVFKIPGILPSFQKFLEYFTTIQKALTKYLETERENFPRFYFVGDEDLLEILGNSNDIPRIQNHLKKMFPGVSQIIIDEEKVISGVKSKEGEILILTNSILISEHKNIISWLRALESAISITLCHILKDAVKEIRRLSLEGLSEDSYFDWIKKYPQQIVILSEKILWNSSLEETLKNSDESKISNYLTENLENLKIRLKFLTVLIRKNDVNIINLKMINLITNLVYMRNKTRTFIKHNLKSAYNFEWLSTMRYYFSEENFNKSPQTCCLIKISDCEFHYGFEYLGLIDYIIQTPLIDNCFLVLTQALKMKLGGSPFGPAGTGKTESVKALGCHLGRMVIVFNCDSNFDFQAMGRIFIGLCRVGAWGCFDEFNRLEERIISAVSQQIHSIQTGLKEYTSEGKNSIELLGKNISLDENVAIFITMNPGYAGRSRLPNNLKQLFRSFAMTQPDRELIGQVILYSQGFTSAESLSSKIIPLLRLCKEQLSQQYHYDFGLRALKSILVSAGNMMRCRVVPETEIAVWEQSLIVQSIMQSVLPKLTSDDCILFLSIIEDIFPNVSFKKSNNADLLQSIKSVCEEMNFQYLDGNETSDWFNKILYFYEILNVNHGIILVGDSCSGKTSCWKVLLEALHRFENIPCHSYIIDPKAITKETLYGNLDPITRVWNDGVFTAIIRNIIENCVHEKERHWIIFDGDIDPEWVENLNSTLDDNKLFTLPNGERLFLPPNVRIIFEVSTLKYATPATISRCGMVYFSESTISINMAFSFYISILTSFNFDTNPFENPFNDTFYEKNKTEITQEQKEFQLKLTQIIRNLVKKETLYLIVEFCQSKLFNIMEFSFIRALQSMFILLSNSIRELYTNQININDNKIESLLPDLVIYCIIWGFVGDRSPEDRLKFCSFLNENLKGTTPSGSIIKCYISFEEGLKNWSDMIKFIPISTEKIVNNDFIINTEETTCCLTLMSKIIYENRSIILCGPPGSGKTMLIHNLVHYLHDWEVITINFSSTTSSEDLLRYLLQKCEFRKAPHNLYLCPKNSKNLIIFCDEINLSNLDNYGTQTAICLLRQLIESGGFYQKDRVWVKLEKIKFIAACNPPSYVGRERLSPKFLRHNFILYIDYPSKESLHSIYKNINNCLDCNENLTAKITDSMIEFYEFMSKEFTLEICAHYLYTPRDLTTWVQGLIELIGVKNNQTPDFYIDCLIHEGVSVFIDRLINQEHRQKAIDKLNEIISNNISTISVLDSINSKVFTNWINNEFNLVDYKVLFEFCKTKMTESFTNSNTFYIYNQLLITSQYINRIIYRNQGHLILVGKNGSGRKSLIKMISTITDLFIYKARWHKNLSLTEFDEEIIDMLKRIVVNNEKILYLIDESSSLPPLFFERILSIISSGDVSDLYSPEKYISLISILKESIEKAGLNIKNNDEMYKWFVQKIKSNFHFLFLLNDDMNEWPNNVCKYSYLFKKCVIKWCGDWSINTLTEVCLQSLADLNFDFVEYESEPEDYICPQILTDKNLKNSVVDSMVSIHNGFTAKINLPYDKIPAAQQYTIFLKQFKNILGVKLSSLEEEHHHISTGLVKLEQTFSEVATMKTELSTKYKELELKNAKASQKLTLMANEQQKAHVTKEEALKLFEEVKIQREIIQTKSSSVIQELSLVEPALEEAKEALSIIDRNMLNEIRVMFKPPQLIKLAIESVYELITGQVPADWKNVKSFLNKDDFIQTIRNFKTENINQERRNLMEKYLNNENFTPEKIARGSAACVPLVKWVRAHVGYNDILTKIDPLKQELAGLEKEKEIKETQANNLQNSINELETKIEEYKNEYSVLIREIEEVKQTLVQTEKKVNASSTLLANLEIEQSRWAASHETFQHRKNILLGNSLLSAAFVCYFGNFDKKFRDILWNNWNEVLNKNKIKFDQNLMRVEYLSYPDETMKWIKSGLPNENLCLENATILKYTTNYSFIIDPSGQAVQFLINMNKDRKAISTSFLNPTFKKELESGLRFGNVLIVNNGEFFDPILHNLIERDFRQLDNRKVVNIGGQEVDFSPSFNIYLITTDPNFIVPSNISSKMNVINFTITLSGLESQCLYQVFKNECPDLEEKRVELTKMQGEYSISLYNMQKKLLQILNEVQGGLLDDDRIVSTLQQLNLQQIEISHKAKDAEHHLTVVNESLKFYLPFATICSNIYFLLQDLYSINSLYHYSLKFFFDIFNSVFTEIPPSPNNNDREHLDILIRTIFKNIIKKVIFGLLEKDKQLFLVLLSRIYLSTFENSAIYIDSIDFVFNSRSITINKEKIFDFKIFNKEENLNLNKILTLQQFSKNRDKILSVVDELSTWAKNSKLNNDSPMCWEEFKDLNQSIYTSLNNLILCEALSPKDVFGLFDRFLTSVFGDDILRIYYSQLDLRTIVINETCADLPLILLSVPGFDPTTWIEDLVSELKIKDMVVVAMGSPESCVIAEKSILQCSKSGHWLVLKNIHLCSHWIKDLEKKIVELKPQKDFRLFLTAEISSYLPSSLIRISRFLTFEPPPGVKPCLTRAFNIVSKTRFSTNPRERSKIYFLLAWIHSLIIERLSYSNLGWSKTYEFSETDLRVAFDMVDSWINRVSQGRQNLPPEKMPWDAMKSLLSQAIYGAYMENTFDSKILDSLIDDFFSPKSFKNNQILVSKNEDQDFDLKIPETFEYDEYIEWIRNLPNQQNTSWLKLPSNAEFILLKLKCIIFNNFSGCNDN